MRHIWSLLLSLTTAFAPWAGARPLAYDRFESRFGEAHQTRNPTNCGIYLSPRAGAKHTDNSAGYRLADLDADQLRETLRELKRDFERGDVNGDLTVTGLTLYDRFNAEFIGQVRAALDDVGLTADEVRVLPNYRPGGEAAVGAPLGAAGMLNAGVTPVAQTAFFFFTFNRGLYKYEALMANHPQGNARARRMAAALTPMIFSISGPVLTWASTSTQVAMQVGSLVINPGQVALAALALGGAYMAWNPMLFEHAIPLTEALAYRPIEVVKQKWQAFKESLERFWSDPAAAS